MSRPTEWVLQIERLLSLSDSIPMHMHLITIGEYVLLEGYSIWVRYKVVKYVLRHAMNMLHLLRLSIFYVFSVIWYVLLLLLSKNCFRWNWLTLVAMWRAATCTEAVTPRQPACNVDCSDRRRRNPLDDTFAQYDCTPSRHTVKFTHNV